MSILRLARLTLHDELGRGTFTIDVGDQRATLTMRAGRRGIEFHLSREHLLELRRAINEALKNGA